VSADDRDACELAQALDPRPHPPAPTAEELRCRALPFGKAPEVWLKERGNFLPAIASVGFRVGDPEHCAFIVEISHKTRRNFIST
jgi:hypothetical protein